MAAPNDTNGDGILDLDVLQREATDEAFRFRAGGRVFTFADPHELDWKVEAAFQAGDIMAVMPILLGDDWPAFNELPLKAWKVEALFKAWSNHFGITVPESSASSPSSAPTGRPSRPISATTTESVSVISVAGG